MRTYETHVTVEDFPTLEQASQFHADMVQMGFKKTNLIALSSGDHPLQLMLAAKEQCDNDVAAALWGRNLSNMCSHLNWRVARLKVESSLQPGHAEYYEAHWKILKGGNDLVQFLQRTPGFLYSWNVLHPEIHYLSRRVYGTQNFKDAASVFMKAEKEISENLTIAGGHYERVLSDTQPDLDNGWQVS